ncbi:hypothetical protein AAXB25_14810 [Paenibacillus lautus]|uniref:hypothetical protein n=1 Tax=Paenibacillus lautus TaxID=1401 RepID=UPI003D2E3830
MSSRGKMVVKIGKRRFEKYPKGATVNIYIGDEEVDMFTNYEIGDSMEKFEESCNEHMEYMKKAHGWDES